MAAEAPTPSDVLREVTQIRADVVREGAVRHEEWRAKLHRPDVSESLLNMAHYIALRSRDLTAVQEALAPLGLSTLGRSESRVIPTLDAVVTTLKRVCGESDGDFPSADAFWYGEQRLEDECETIFGPSPAGRRGRIMVTLGNEAALDDGVVRELLLAGMNVARINCGHDSPETWQRVIERIRQSERETALTCRVAMDLSGPRARIEAVFPDDGPLILTGDRLLLTRDTPRERPEFKAQLQSGIPEVVDQLSEGASVWIDAGAIGTTVCGREPGGLVLRVDRIRPKGRRLRPGKGLNFPGSRIRLPALTDDDLAALQFIARHADIVDYSFVQNPADVDRLFSELERLGRPADSIGLILKIETQAAIERLPSIVVASTSRAHTAVMIARGDLAVEVGFGRMAEMQEELLWLCEAAHVPVVWATDVLANLARKGTWARAEVTDAAMAERADCVMLNKGPFIVEAVRALDDVIRRMEGHQTRKRPRMRRLEAWSNV